MDSIYAVSLIGVSRLSFFLEMAGLGVAGFWMVILYWCLFVDVNTFH